MSSSTVTPGLMLAGGSSGNPAGLGNPSQLEVTYQNLLSGAADIVSGLHTKTLILTAGAIGTAGAIQIGNTETAPEVANNQKVLDDIAAFCNANGITVEVDAVLTNPARYGTGATAINALVNQWATAAAMAGLPISAVQDVQEIGVSQSPIMFANYASVEVNAVQTLVKDYARSSYHMTAQNLAVGDMEGGGISNIGSISAWWNAYNSAASFAGVQSFSYTTADIGWFAPWIASLSQAAWQGYLTALSTLTIADRMALNIVVQGAETDTSANQFIHQAEQNAADLAILQATGSVSISNIMLQSWSALPVGVGMITSPTSSPNEAAEIRAVYPLYLTGSITASGSASLIAPGQVILNTGTAQRIDGLSLRWDSADIQAGGRIGVVIIDQTGTLQAAEHGSGTVSNPASNILVLSGNYADLALELASIALFEPNAGPDTINVQAYGTTGWLSDSQIAVLAAAPGQPVNAINASSNLQGWVSSSSILNSGTVITGGSLLTSEILQWNTTGSLAGTIGGTATTGQSAFVKIVSVHEPLAEYGVEIASGALLGTATNRVADIFDPKIDDGAFPANGYANNPGVNNVSFSPLSGWLPNSFNPAAQLTPLTVISTTNLFDPVGGQMETSIDRLAADPLTVVDLTGTVADTFATAFNNGGTQVTQFNTGGNAAWQPGWGNQFRSATLTYDGAGRLVEAFFQGGAADPLFTIDDVYDPNTGQLWEEFQSTTPPPITPGTTNYATTNVPYQPGFNTGPLYVTEFNTGNNPNWNYVDWGSVAFSDTEVWTDYFIMANFSGFAESFPAQSSGGMNAYPYEFVNGSALDLMYLPGTINVDLNALASIVLNSQEMTSGLSNLSTIDCAGATGSVTITGLTTGGCTLIGGSNATTIAGYGHDTIIAGSGLTTINTGSGGSTVLVSTASGSTSISGNDNVVTAAAGSTVSLDGVGNTLNGSGVTINIVGSGTGDVVNGSNNTISIVGFALTLNTASGNSVSVSDTSANIAANLGSLEILAVSGELTSIILTDSGTPILSLSDTQITGDSAALARIVSPYVLDPTASEALAAAALPNVVAVDVTDTEANVLADLSVLESLAVAGRLGSITLTGSTQQDLGLSAAQIVDYSAVLAHIVPTIVGAVADQAVTIGTLITPFSHVVIGSAVAGQLESLTVTLSAAANGVLSHLGAGSYNVATGVYTDTGSSAAVTADLEGLLFCPTAGNEAFSQNLSIGFTISISNPAGKSTTNTITSVIAAAPAAPISRQTPVSENFYGGTTSDVLFTNVNGDISLWNVQNGVAIGASGLGHLANGWGVAGTGDFYGTGTAGLLFENTNGDIVQWQMKNGQAFAATSVGVTDPSQWSVVGTGDFYGTGVADVLFRNKTTGAIAQWQVENGVAVAATTIGVVAPDTTIAAIGKLTTGAGADSILFINSSGVVADWNMGNGQTVAANYLGQTSSYWSVVGLGDFTGNGQNDILFQGQGGEIAMWTTQNGHVVGADSIGKTTSSWKIVGIGDYTGNGTDDILFENTNGSLAAWEMQNGHVSQVVNVGATSSDWRVGPVQAGITLPS